MTELIKYLIIALFAVFVSKAYDQIVKPRNHNDKK